MRHPLRYRPTVVRSLAVLLLCTLAVLSARGAESRLTGPWDMAALKQVPAATWGEKVGLVQEVYYEGEPLGGKPTRVFAYYGRPEKGDGPFPAMVLVHGGGGTAFSEWATLWAQRGYAAMAMDLAGCGPGRKRLVDGGPDQGHDQKFARFTDDQAAQIWTYHAVAAVVRGHSLLASRPEVDPHRIGITGISWGGYLTCIVTGLDDRLKVSVPVYGCGFLNENSAWLEIGRLAWNLGKWLAQLALPAEVVRWEWKRYRKAFVYVAAEVVKRSRQVWVRLSPAHRFADTLVKAHARLQT